MGEYVTIKKSLADALIESGMQHHDLGGFISSAISPVARIVGGVGKDITGALTTQSNAGVSTPAIQEQQFLPQIGLHVQQTQDVYNQQQSLAQALLAQSQGQGPNPAQAMLANQTGQNAQAQAALMASQRGAGVNPALIARQAAMQGGAMQQQSTGQAAALQAQQQLQAQQLLQAQQQQMASQQLQAQQIQQGALASQNQLGMGGQQFNAGVQNQNAQMQNQMMGSLLNAAGGAASMAMGKPMADGGKVPGKPEVPHDSPENDKVLSLLSPGEVVLPLSVTKSKDPVKAAVSFLEQLGLNKAEEKGFKKVASAKKSVGDRLDALEKFACGGKVSSYADGGVVGSILDDPSMRLGIGLNPPEKIPLEEESSLSTQPSKIASMSPSLPTGQISQGEFSQAAMPQTNALDQYGKAAKAEEAGILSLGKAQSDLAKAQESTYEKANKDMETYMSMANQKLQEQDMQNKALSDDIAATKIDPKNFWNKMETGNKIGTAIAMVFSGLGAGMSGQQNMAMAVINKAMEQDLEAQKMNLGKKESLLSANLRKYGDMQAATHATMLQMNAITQGKIAQDAARLGSPVALANAQIALSELQKKDLIQKQALNQLVQTNATKAAIANSQGGIDAELYRKLPHEMRQTMAPLPNGKFVDVGDKTKAEEASMLMNKNANIQSNLNKLESLVKKYGTFELTGPAQKDMKQYVDAIATDAAILFDPKTGVREGELEKFKNMLFEPGALLTRNKSATENINNMKRMMKDRESVYYKSLGLSPEGVGVNAGETQVKNGITYRKVPGGWMPVK